MGYSPLLLIQISLLAVLALFGVHRLFLVLTYLRRPVPQSTKELSEWPRVCIQLPLFNEGTLVRRLLTHIAALDYPPELLEVQILDDSNDARSRNASHLTLPLLLQKGIRARVLSREQREGYKAGALAAGLKQSEAPFVAIFDADFMPPSDFLRTCLPQFADPGVDMVQCRWGHANRHESLLTRAEAVLLDAHFFIEHQARAARGHFFNFNGTAGIWRAAAIHGAGGWQGDTLTEDLDLSYRAQLAGSRFVYLPDYSVPAELPASVAAFRSQQQRWTKGAVEVLRKLAASIRRAEIPRRLKLESFFHLGANFCYPVLLLAGLLLLPLILSLDNSVPAVSSQAAAGFVPQELLIQALRYSLGIGFWSVAFFFFVAALHSRKREAARVSLPSVFLDVLLALLCGIALSFSNSLALFQGLRGRKTAFVRTPKSTSVGDKRKAFAAEETVELLLCLYFGVTLWLSLRLAHLELLIFCSLFFLAFGSLSCLNLRSVWGRRRAWRSAKVRPQVQAS